MERVIYKHVYNYLHQNRLVYEYQSGFLPKHSTIHQLLEIYNNILNSLEKKEANCFQHSQKSWVILAMNIHKPNASFMTSANKR